MRDADRRLGLVDVLAAGAARPKHVDAQIGWIELDLDVVVDLRRNEYGGERRMAPMTRVERRLAHEAVHARLGAQPTVRVLAVQWIVALLMPATSPADCSSTSTV